MAIGDFRGDGRPDIALADNTGAAVSVLLQGPTDLLSKTNLTFAQEVVGTASGAQTVTLTNTSIFALAITSIAVTGTDSGDFRQANTCGSSVPARASCTISIVFNPTQIGPRTAAITITDNISLPQTIALSGTGVVAGPNATLSPSSLTYAVQLRNTSSPAQSITLINYGSETLSVAGISIKGADPGDFSQTNTCGASLASGAVCLISVTFTPRARGNRPAALTLKDNVPGSPQTVALTGTTTY